ncbi:hypothetical protein [Mesorhizobium atlanticum]|uniref:hypothetical protein n=1 Tax=Mesorhizobium atlanticum TaxID=2233532 RepID=UPI0015EC2516|nr:hypothetical protein [Mesorhizobium atlanticum]
MVVAYQALRGVSFMVAVTFVSEVGDVRSLLRQPAPVEGLSRPGALGAPAAETVKRGGQALTGNCRARRVLVEGTWSYRYPARVTEPIRVRLEGLPKAVREIA